MKNNSGVLSFQDVSLQYSPTGPFALRNVSFDVGAGERVALVGPSGSGKTTVLSAANGLVVPTSGEVVVNGVVTADLNQRKHRSTRATIGSVPQGNALVGPLRVAHNVASGRLGQWGPLEVLRTLVRPRDTDEILAVLNQVGIGDKLWERADNLSGGQQQRVAIARTLFQKANLILADEPVSALDPARSEAVLELLVDVVSSEPDRALVTSMHDAPLALKHCTRIIGLRLGVLAFDLPADEVDESQLDSLYELDD